jgi:hypothetical protein
MLDHLVGLLLRALIAQVTGANPLQVQIAMRACKTDQSFEAMIDLAAAVINSR